MSTVTVVTRGVRWSHDDVINPDELLWDMEQRAERKDPIGHLYVMHDHGFVVCVVYEESEQEAIEEAADQDKLDRWKVTDVDRGDYTGEQMEELFWFDGDAYDLEGMDIVELEVPPLDVALLMKHHQEEVERAKAYAAQRFGTGEK
jgi:hypothetical protein